MPLFSETPICKKAKILCLLFNFALPWNPHVLFTHNFPGKAGANLVFKRESWWKVVGQSRLGILQGNSPEKNILVKKKKNYAEIQSCSMWIFSQKKLNLLKIMNGILSDRWRKNPTFPFLLLPFLLLRGQIWAPKNTRKRNWSFQTPPSSQHSCGCPTKSCARCFFKLKEKKKHAKTRENSKFVKHYLWVSLVFQEIHRNTRNHKDMFLTYPAD